MKQAEKNIEQMTYEEALGELAQITAQLEESNLPLEEMLQRYEQGQKLANRCNQLLDEAELKIKDLSSGGVSTVEPLLEE